MFQKGLQGNWRLPGTLNAMMVQDLVIKGEQRTMISKAVVGKRKGNCPNSRPKVTDKIKITVFKLVLEGKWI